MRLITWNCNMAFRKKAHLLLELDPDILVIPECEHPDILKLDISAHPPTDQLWFGKNRNKGLGIFSYNQYRLKPISKYNRRLRTIAPIEVSKDDFRFNLFAIWANNPNDPRGPYVEQVWNALRYYDTILNNTPSVLIGDFNSNTIWDRPQRVGNHSHVVERLQKKDIHSTYHAFHKQEQGKEEHATLYMYRHEDKSYHIDYCFVSEDLLSKLDSVEIGSHKPWTQFSDHVPLIVTFK